MADIKLFHAQRQFDRVAPNLIALLKEKNTNGVPKYSFSSDEVRATELKIGRPTYVALNGADGHTYYLIIAFTPENTFSSGETNSMIEAATKDKNVNGVILFLNTDVSTPMKATLRRYRQNKYIEKLLFRDLVFNMRTNYLMESHRLLSPDEKDELYSSLQKDGFKITETTLPTIFIRDKLAIWYGAQANDVIGIQHQSSHLNYRPAQLANNTIVDVPVPRRIQSYRRVQYPSLKMETFINERAKTAEKATR